ncbi:hypothetical protein QQ39_06745 [Pragia fontium]|nr:hypothetical protein QQ39_06745 [Pragia fontium]
MNINVLTGQKDIFPHIGQRPVAEIKPLEKKGGGHFFDLPLFLLTRTPMPPREYSLSQFKTEVKEGMLNFCCSDTRRTVILSHV